ncbi:DUF4333 domain-containing protein [Antrihabitans sp. YC2-6]|uniref:DUF4333 domain-containing protein n=1 Tax=Antrihabitans sp. YC2-6 TaxID=2799498 RepID=UPI0018F6000C|nr:DUF4333 domain-containing protein [Antrihabitans sp. YC2-6]MBJ8348229.1 DUF4333 domain-containing protein [Antrihabitans sp. YC2-6]
MKRHLLPVLAIVAGGLLAAGGCSSTATVDNDDVVKQVTDFVDAQLGKPDKVDCPTLDAEKDKTVTCTATVEGTSYDVKVKVTEVTDKEAKFDITLGDSDSSSSSTSEEATTSRSTTTRRSSTTTEEASATEDAGAAVAATDVAEQISTTLSEQVGQVPDDVTCPDNLPATVGAELTCLLTDGPDQYDVAVTVTSVEGTDVKFDIQVADQPN